VLLSLICLVLQDAGELPSQTAALYRKGIRLLLEKWNDRKDIPEWEIGKEAYRQLTIEEKEALLTEIAARKFENSGNFVLFEQADLTQQVVKFLRLSNRQDGEAVLRAIEAQHGLLVERANELWSFSHLTFQEYFTAQWLNQLNHDTAWAKIMADERWKNVVKLAVQSQQTADQLVRLIKQAIDYSVSTYLELQSFLGWVQSKAEAIHAIYKPAAIRAFYFVLDFDFDFDFALDIDPTFDFDRARYLDIERALDINLDLDFILDLALDRDMDNTYTFDYNFDLDLARVRAYDLADNPELATKLQCLREQLPTRSNEQMAQIWWQNKGQSWKQELRQVMIEHRNIGHSWQFNELQEEALKRYYDANKFLIELLKEPRAVSDSVRQEIEDNLLLPIATLQQRLPEHYN